MAGPQVLKMLIFGLLGWGLWIALGSLRQNRGIEKSIITAGFVLAFVGFWALLLARRNRRPWRKHE
ncbi:MAG: hypothetical protein O2931_02120 [Planctomycetota bacterium]|nr:hypothetical protein [Planctomycetota bacterium]MDA1177570.1 hypothetical protein [Planctomycetota bacterium]